MSFPFLMSFLFRAPEVTSPMQSKDAKGTQCKWCLLREGSVSFNKDSSRHLLPICATCQESRCAYCGKAFTIVQGDKNIALKEKPLFPCCQARICELHEKANHVKCSNKNCPDKKKMPINPWILNEHGQQFSQKRFIGSTNWKNLCSKCSDKCAMT